MEGKMYCRRQWNSSKTAVCLLLELVDEVTSLPADRISQLTGIPLQQVRISVNQWTRWGYLRRKKIDISGKSLYHYWLASRGKRFLQNARMSYGRYFIDVEGIATGLTDRVNRILAEEEEEHAKRAAGSEVWAKEGE